MMFVDMILLSYTPASAKFLQHQLNLLARSSDSLDLTVNLEKLISLCLGMVVILPDVKRKKERKERKKKW